MCVCVCVCDCDMYKIYISFFQKINVVSSLALNSKHLVVIYSVSAVDICENQKGVFCFIVTLPHHFTMHAVVLVTW